MIPRNPMFRYRDLPPELESLVSTLTELTMDLRWTWSHSADSVWRSLDPQTWTLTKNPFAIFQGLTRDRLQQLHGDKEFRKQLDLITTQRDEHYRKQTWFSRTHTNAPIKGIAYFSMEFGIGEALPLYAGGLGVLAGDYLKGACDLGIPVVGIGLLYGEGYFRQTLDPSGYQQEAYPHNDSTILPVFPVETKDGSWLRVTLEGPLYLRVWQAQVGRVTLYLLDSNDPMNHPAARGITGKLYGGGQQMRLLQEIVLGTGGWRLIEALGLDIDICHLNEGHAAFVTLDRARSFMERNKVDFWEALWATRAGNVFTTHTPVAAAFDTYPPEMLAPYRYYADRLGVPQEALGALGRKNPKDLSEPFNMAYLAVRTCAHVNGVSRLHGAVSRHIFQDLYPDWPNNQVPVTHVTNGVHVPSWDSAEADDLWTRACGKDRWKGSVETLQKGIEALSDEELWDFRTKQRMALVQRVRARLPRQLRSRGLPPDRVAEAENVLDPNTLTLGFARRFTEYKRPNLLLRDPARLSRLLQNSRRPVQIVIAGKAHPADDYGKQMLQQWVQFAGEPAHRNRMVVLEDYDIALAQEMVQGVDVWGNMPRRPWEASGTSGMKVLVNGGLNLSELDGWWAEAYGPDVGWGIGSDPGLSAAEQDRIEAEQLYRLLEEEVIPAFYGRDESNIPRAWVARMRASMSRLTGQFSTNRMLQEYVEQIYIPAAELLRERTAEGGKEARELRSWEVDLKRHWSEIHFGERSVKESDGSWVIEVPVYLGEIGPEAVEVQLYAEGMNGDGRFCEAMSRGDPLPGAINGYRYRGQAPHDRPAEHFTPRVVPHHAEANVPGELELIRWQA